MTKILQISDTHILPKGELFCGRINTAAALRNLLSNIRLMLPQIGPLEQMVITGDLSESGCVASYELFADIMQDSPLPWRAIPGNHDRREPMAEILGGDICDWRQDLDEITLIGMDTLVEGSGHGEMSAAQINWLERQLADLGERPVLLFFHHPPITSGIELMDQIRLTPSEGLQSVLSAFSGDLQIGCGHLHRVVGGRFASHPLFVAPGVSHSFVHNTSKKAELRMTPHQGGALLHSWSPEDGWTCNVLSGQDFAYPNGVQSLL